MTVTLEELEKRLAAIEKSLEADGEGGVLPSRKTGGDAQIMKKVATRLQDFESQITAQLANLQTDFDKKLSHVNRGAAATKPVDGAGGAAGLDTMAEDAEAILDMRSAASTYFCMLALEICDTSLLSFMCQDLDQLKYDVGELKDLLGNNKGEVNHIRRIVLACERDMEDFTAAMDAVNVDLDEMRARVDATHSIITSRQRVEATMTAEISTMRLDIGDIQEALKNHDSWMEDVSNTLQQMQEKEENLTEDIINLKNEMNTKLDTKVDNEANDDLDAAIKTVRDMVSSLRLDVDARRRKVDEILATIRHDITAVETNLEESKAKITSDTDQAVNALNGRIDFTNKDLAATQESLHTTQNSLSDCFNEVAVVRSDLERNVADTEARLKNDIRQKQQEAFEKIGAVEQQAELRSAEASRRLGALDLRMSGVQGGLGEHKRDILKLREEVNGLTVKSASHEVDIQKNSDATRKMEKQRNMDEQNWKAQMDAVHDVLDTKVNEKPFEDLKHCTAALTRGVVKFAQVVGVFPGPKFDDAEGADQGEADVELLGWEECAENMSFRVDKAWRQRCSQRFRNILDMVAKKADHSVLRLLQISQQHIESQLERVKHERELWKEVVERATASWHIVDVWSYEDLQDLLSDSDCMKSTLSMKTHRAGKFGGLALLRSGDVFLERLGISYVAPALSSYDTSGAGCIASGLLPTAVQPSQAETWTRHSSGTAAALKAPAERKTSRSLCEPALAEQQSKLRIVSAVTVMFYLFSNTYSLVYEDLGQILHSRESQHFLLSQEAVSIINACYHQWTGKNDIGVTGQDMICCLELAALLALWCRFLWLLYTVGVASSRSGRKWLSVQAAVWEALPELCSFSAMRALHFVTPAIIMSNATQKRAALAEEGVWTKTVEWGWFVLSRIAILLFGLDALMLKCRENQPWFEGSISLYKCWLSFLQAQQGTPV
eukprot:s966_g6.t5